MRVSEFLIKVDNVCDYIPGVSTLTNLVELVAWTVRDIFSASGCCKNSKKLSSLFAEHLKNKKNYLFIFPLVNIYFSCLRDFPDLSLPVNSLNFRQKALRKLQKLREYNELVTTQTSEKITWNELLVQIVEDLKISNKILTAENIAITDKREKLECEYEKLTGLKLIRKDKPIIVEAAEFHKMTQEFQQLIVDYPQIDTSLSYDKISYDDISRAFDDRQLHHAQVKDALALVIEAAATD
ncbi:MAG: hypothetical protein K1000chlam4_00633 [Chlamydiae bacterium]|nr:hypothetical protein [Chlamydiota bacterium]